MEETLYKICHSCSDSIVDGCDSMTLEQAKEWLSQNDENEIETECGDTSKYILIPLSQD